MSVASHNEAKKVGAVIYLSTNRPLHLPDSLTEFHQSRPHLLLQKTGKEPPEPCSVSASPTSHSNFITRPSRKQEVTWARRPLHSALAAGGRPACRSSGAPFGGGVCGE